MRPSEVIPCFQPFASLRHRPSVLLPGSMRDATSRSLRQSKLDPHQTAGLPQLRQGPHLICPSSASGSGSTYAANRCALRALCFAASTSRSFGGAEVMSWPSSLAETSATSSTARSNAEAFACEGLVKPLTFRTYCRAALRTSSSVAGGSKLWSVRMFRHMKQRLAAQMPPEAVR